MIKKIMSLDSLINIVYEAGDKILPLRNNSELLNVSKKNNNTLLTNADLLANEIICSNLKQSKIPILSEENIIELNSDLYWIIDPLDGTKDYVNNSNEFTVNIALIENGIPVIGLIYAPALNQLFVRYLDKDCFSVINDKKIFINEIKSINSKNISLLRSKSETSNVFNKINSQYKVIRENAISSSLKFGKLFTNQFNIYFRTVGSSEWDIAAGHALLLGIGGNIINLKTKTQMNYNKPNFRNSEFIAYNSFENPIIKNIENLYEINNTSCRRR